MDIRNIVFLVVIFIAFLTTIFILAFKLKKSKTYMISLSTQLQNLKLQSTYRFEEDIKFLSYIAGFKCKVYTDLILSPSTELSETKLLKGTEQEEAVKEIVMSVINSLSDEYIQLLMKYFTLESLKEYIAELVLNQVTSTITQLNNEKMRKFVRSAVKDGEFMFKKKDIE